jgi:WD40 repeat protein
MVNLALVDRTLRSSSTGGRNRWVLWVLVELVAVAGSERFAVGLVGADEDSGWCHGVRHEPHRAGVGVVREQPLATTERHRLAWSPDGTHIAFDTIDGDGHIRLLDLTTGALTDLGQGALPRWSPDGTRLVLIVADGDGVSDLYTMAADGNDRVRLTDDPAFDTLPQWTPDGTTIWYATLRHGDG